MSINAACTLNTVEKIEELIFHAKSKFVGVHMIYISEGDALDSSLVWDQEAVSGWRIYRFPISDGRSHLLLHRDGLFVKDIVTRNRCLRISFSNSPDISTAYDLTCFCIHGSQTSEDFTSDLADLSILC